MNDDLPIRTEVRLARREQRLGADATCVICGESALEALGLLSMRLIEQHHVVGKNHDPNLKVPVCRHCHAKFHEGAAQEGADLREAPRFLERLLNMLRSLAVFFRMLGDALGEWARRVERLIRDLDKGFPEWRAKT